MPNIIYTLVRDDQTAPLLHVADSPLSFEVIGEFQAGAEAITSPPVAHLPSRGVHFEPDSEWLNDHTGTYTTPLG